MEDGERFAGAAIVGSDDIIWKAALPKGTTTQRAELVALMQALYLRESIYTDSWYVFVIIHVHRARPFIRRTGLLTAEVKKIETNRRF